MAALCTTGGAFIVPAAMGDSAVTAAERRARSSRQPLYNGSEPSISQISPAIRRTRQPRFRKWWRRRKQHPSLADALGQPPTPASEPVLRGAGVPIVPGVPSIVILEPRSKEDRDRDRAIRSQQQ